MTKPLSQQSLIDPEVIRCPFPFYAQLHAEAPVHRDVATGFYVVSRYADMQAITKDVASFSNVVRLINNRPQAAPAEAEAILATGYARPSCLNFSDPPHHARYRKLVDRAFTAGRVRELTPYIDDVVSGLIDAMCAAGCDGADGINFVRAFAVPLPCIVIADQLGVDRADIPLLKIWSDAILDPIGLLCPPEREIECARQVVDFQTYFAARIAERRAAPRDDILSTLAASTDGDDGFSTEEILNLLEQLLTGGNDTTTSTLSGAMLLLLQNPETLTRLRADPTGIRNFVEEALRMETPVQGLFRQTLREITVGDVAIPKGAVVMLRHGAVNRDPAKFIEPDRFDPERANAGAHLAFGAGIHFCPGAMLARQELASAFTQLLARFASFELVPGANDFAYRPSFFLRGLTRLQVRLRTSLPSPTP